MSTWVPDDIQEEFGTGEPVCVKFEVAAEVVAGLEQVGYTCARDDDLIARACGYRACGLTRARTVHAINGARCVLAPVKVSARGTLAVVGAYRR